MATLGGPKKTPLEIAHEILIKNGYLPSVPETSARGPLPAPAAHQTAGSGTRDCRPESTAVVALDSPVKLTKEQQQLIETRRQEALARRRRVQQVARPHVHPPPAVIEPSRPPDEGLRQMRRATVPIQEQQHLVPGQVSRLGSSRPAGYPKAPTQCGVTEESSARTGSVVDETKHARPECFWDDLEAAAEIVQWENEHMAEAALEQQQQLPATQIAPDEECGDTYQSSHHRRESPAVDNRPPTVISFSQELLAAADIVQWEKERERDVPEVPGTLSSGFDHRS